jgi:hypothetical protein
VKRETTLYWAALSGLILVLILGIISLAFQSARVLLVVGQVVVGVGVLGLVISSLFRQQQHRKDFWQATLLAILLAFGVIMFGLLTR